MSRDGVCVAGWEPSGKNVAWNVSQSLSSRQGHPVLIGSKSCQPSRPMAQGQAASPHTAWRAGHTELVEALAKIAKQEVHHPGNEVRVSVPGLEIHGPNMEITRDLRGPCLWKPVAPVASGVAKDVSGGPPRSPWQEEPEGQDLGQGGGQHGVILA